MVDITSSFPQSEKSFVSYRVTLLIYSVTGFQMLVMLHLYFEVVLQPADGQTSKDKLLSNSMINLFSDQCLFDFSCLFLFVLVEKLRNLYHDNKTPFCTKSIICFTQICKYYKNQNTCSNV